MARWMLVCPHCSHRFEYSKVAPDIVEQAFRDPFRIVPKLKFTNGETKKCPGCSKESLYHAFELLYNGNELALGAAGSG
jgi:hypothetical protein